MGEAVKVAAKAPATDKKKKAQEKTKSNLSLSMNSPVEKVLFLQRTIGNRAVGRLIKSGISSTEGEMISGTWNDCGTEADCPAREAGERTRARTASLQVGSLTSPETGVIVSHFKIGSSDVSSIDSSPGWAPFWGSLVTHNDRWEILGFSDCEGGVERNTELRWMRAMHVNNALPALARAKIDRFRAAPLSDCVAENDSEEHRALNRSVVFKRTVTEYTFEEEELTGITCPPRSRAAVTNLSDYVALLMCAERQTGYNPRNMLAMMRQIYYGKQWSSVSQTNKWDNVIPCSPDLGNPESRLGSDLYHALRNSSEIGSVDVGHVFTGLESMTCPSPNVEFFWGLAAVNMPNEEFATWGGDLGAAAAAHVACPQLGADAATHEDCGNTAGAQPLGFYFGVHAPSQDLEGDIDPYVMRANLMGIPCTGSARRAFTPARPISEIFQDYYNDPSSLLGTARANRYLCFLQAIGASVSGGAITNRSTIRTAISNRVFSFADAFYTKIRGFPITSDAGDRVHMRINSDRVTDWFLTYLESRL